MRRAPTGSGTGTGRVTLAPFPCPCGVTRTFLQRPCAGAADRLRRKGLHRGHQQGFRKNLGGEPLLLAFRFVCLTRGVHSRTLVITPPVTIVGVIAYFVASQPWLASTHHPNPVPRPHTCCGHHARRSSARVRRGRARRARAQQGHLRQGGEAIRQEWCAPPLSTHRAAAPCSLQRLVLAPNEPPTLQTSARDPHPVFAAFIKFLAPW